MRRFTPAPAARAAFIQNYVYRLTACLFAVLFIVLISAPSAFASGPVAGHIAYMYGKVSVMKESQRGRFVPAKVGDALSAGDVIKTGGSSKAQINLEDGSTIYAAANSQMKLKDYIVNRDSAQRKVAVSDIEGRLRFVVSKVVKVSTGNTGKWKSSSFVVETPTAVAGVQGTDFVVTVNRGITTVAVFEGYVKIGNVSYFVRGSITLSANQASTVKKDASPTPATTLTDAQKNLLKTTTTPQVQTEGAPPTTVPAEVIAAENAEIEAALQAVVDELARSEAKGLSPETIISNAIAAGLDVNETFAATFTLGADPAAAVAEAIKAGFPADDVMQVALLRGMPLNTVAQAALAAGASRKDLIEGAQLAGKSADQIAAALSSQVFSFTPTTGNTTNNTSTTGGTGGAPPSTSPTTKVIP